jgi:hypothetical protein
VTARHSDDFEATSDTPGYQRVFAELKRRRVLRVMAVYGVLAFAIIEVADAIFPRMALPEWTVTLVVWLALLGFPIAIVLTWALEMTPEGVRRTAEAAPGELIEQHEQGWAFNIAYVMAFRGATNSAFEWLDKAVEYNDPGLAEIPVENLFANIHDDPRWLPFLESIGKSPEQLAAIEFEVTLPQ